MYRCLMALLGILLSQRPLKNENFCNLIDHSEVHTMHFIARRNRRDLWNNNLGDLLKFHSIYFWIFFFEMFTDW